MPAKGRETRPLRHEMRCDRNCRGRVSRPVNAPTIRAIFDRIRRGDSRIARRTAPEIVPHLKRRGGNLPPVQTDTITKHAGYTVNTTEVARFWASRETRPLRCYRRVRSLWEVPARDDVGIVPYGVIGECGAFGKCLQVCVGTRTLRILFYCAASLLFLKRCCVLF